MFPMGQAFFILFYIALLAAAAVTGLLFISILAIIIAVVSFGMFLYMKITGRTPTIRVWRFEQRTSHGDTRTKVIEGEFEEIKK